MSRIQTWQNQARAVTASTTMIITGDSGLPIASAGDPSQNVAPENVVGYTLGFSSTNVVNATAVTHAKAALTITTGLTGLRMRFGNETPIDFTNNIGQYLQWVERFSATGDAPIPGTSTSFTLWLNDLRQPLDDWQDLMGQPVGLIPQVELDFGTLGGFGDVFVKVGWITSNVAAKWFAQFGSPVIGGSIVAGANNQPFRTNFRGEPLAYGIPNVGLQGTAGGGTNRATRIQVAFGNKTVFDGDIATALAGESDEMSTYRHTTGDDSAPPATVLTPCIWKRIRDNGVTSEDAARTVVWFDIPTGGSLLTTQPFPVWARVPQGTPLQRLAA